ncbi:MAG TPA: acyl-CoA desaturase [Phycisphaerae bacterium]|jgi:linoleoyl-CoA desaturase
MNPVIEASAEPSGDYQSPKFTNSDRFLHALRKHVDAYFEKSGRSKRDSPRMYFKTATILLWFFGAYFTLMFVVHSWLLIVPLAIVMGLGLAAIGFNIQHDGGHKAYSKRAWVNKAMALTLDLMGGSSYLWDWKHNSIHHTYTNITGHDDDIDLGFLARLSPHQRRFWFHRLQGIYLWVLYGFLAIKWHLVDDFYQVYTAKIGDKKIPRPKGWDLVTFITGKVFFFSMAFVVPMIFHPVLAVLLVYAIAAFTSGLVLSVVFQLAHCVEGAEFPMPVANAEGLPRMETGWAVHQVQTTVDFSRGNPLMSWFVGGLNYQIEHHLFPKICHVHYPKLSKVVEEVCREFNVKYAHHRTFFSAVASHYRWLVEMGRAPAVSP